MMSYIGDMSKNKTTAFLSYIRNPLSRTSIELLYSSNYIMYEKSDLYRDFVLSLMELTFDTYMGDVVTDKKQRNDHFNWCWNRTVSNFEMEGIHFGENQELFNYFENFMVEVYYLVEDKDHDVDLTYNIIKLWKHIFNYQIDKTRSDIDTFIDVYKMFEKSLKKGKKLDF